MDRVIPNIYHFIFGLRPQRKPFGLVHYLCLRSCINVNRPERVYFYYLHKPFGPYWDLIRAELTLESVEETPLVTAMTYPDPALAHYRYAHDSDFIRLEKLVERGGIYADMDTIFVNAVPQRLFEYPFVMGREQDVVSEREGKAMPSLCNALFMSEPEAEFGKRWLERSAEAFDGTWSSHSGFLPWKLSQELPASVHVEPPRSFFSQDCSPAGLQQLFEGYDPNFDGIYSMHLWHHMWASWWRRDFTRFHEGQLTEDYIRSVDTTYTLAARPFLPCSPKGFVSRNESSKASARKVSRQVGMIDHAVTRLGLFVAGRKALIDAWYRNSNRHITPLAEAAGGRRQDAEPFVSVVIPTKDRGPAIAATIESIVRCNYANREIVVVDQSADGEAAEHLRAYIESDQIRFVAVSSTGVAANRETGALAARGDLIAYTDDDCVVAASWLQQIVEAFAANLRVGMVFGNVRASPCDETLGFVQSYIRVEPSIAERPSEKHLVEGIGACMAIRRSVWREAGGFDLMLGTGGPFRSAEETDLAFRVLLRGHAIYETPAIEVTHTGFRRWEEHPTIVQNYMYGLGAMSAKHLKAGRSSMLLTMYRLLMRWTFRRPIADLGRTPPRVLRLRAYVSGFLAAMTTGVDRRTGRFSVRNEHG